METIINKVIIGKYASYNEALADMLAQGVKHLGWINNNKVRVPQHLEFDQVYANPSGTSCLYVDIIHRVAYSVDMGD